MEESITPSGDRMTDPQHKGRLCRAVRRTDGKCIRGKNGAMLIEWEDGARCVVIGRLLRRIVLPIGG